MIFRASVPFEIRLIFTYIRRYFLLFFLAFHTAILLFTNFHIRLLGFDEFTVLTISKQPLFTLFRTITSEPHPPGFYLFLHALSILSPSSQVIKAISILLHFSLLFLSLLYAYKQKIIQKFHLTVGLSLFISSYTYTSIAYQLKQDAISFPIFLLFCFFCIKTYWNSGSITIKSYLISLIMCIALLFFGYIYFFFAILIITLITAQLLLWKRFSFRNLIFFLSPFALFVLMYYYIFGANQYENNIPRFNWISSYQNSFFSQNVLFFTNKQLDTFFSDVIILIPIIGVILFYTSTDFSNQTKKIALISGICVLLLSYSLHLFSQSRYALLMFLIILLISGIGLEKYKKTTSFIIVILFFTKTAFFMSSYEKFEQATSHISSTLINTTLEGERTAMITNPPYAAQYYKLQFLPKNNQVHAVHVEHPSLFTSTTISHDDLYHYGYSANIDPQQIFNTMKLKQIDNVFYIFSSDRVHDDKDNIILQSLFSNCTKTSLTTFNYFTLFFLFSECRWEPN